MAQTDSAFKKKDILLMALLSLVAMALVTVAVVPSLRGWVKDLVVNSERTILAKAHGAISPEGPLITVLKIKNKDALSLEVYSESPEGLVLMAKLPLFETRDGYFLLQGNATNLAIADVDKDGSMEIVAPTYDEQMVPRLNVFRYNSQTHSFDRATAPDDFGR
ncbi:MAG: hypothetical protein AAGB31_06270 [Bdellovibrio sp.]